MTLARIYGRETGNGSLAVVTRGFERAFKQADIFAGLYGIDTADSYADGEAPDAGASARHAVFTGPLGAAGKMFEAGRHAHHWVTIAPNSDQLPRALVADLKRYRDQHSLRFLAPSEWAAGVVRGFLGECTTVPHGVMPEFRANAALADEVRLLFRAGTFRVVHFSTSDRQRKGTIELLQAWRLMGLSHAGLLRGARLLCVLDYAAKLALEEALSEGEVEGWAEIRSTVTLKDRADLPPDAMAHALASAHVVCQPSRGEGFGLIPLEALCCGTPIVATYATGHLQYLRARSHPSSAVLIAPGPDAPIDDLPGSRAPSVTPMSIAEALCNARDQWPTLHSDAQSGAHLWQSNWSWEASLEAFVSLLRST
jgi:glycosyltransferase involved in cell wall biosynthesis